MIQEFANWWRPSTLAVRTRVLPSGRPPETVEVLEQPDPTWQLEFDHFLNLCATGETNLQNDLWISSVFDRMKMDPRLITD